MNLDEFQLPIMKKLYSTEASVRTEDEDSWKYFSQSGKKGIDNPSHFPIIILGDEPRTLNDKNELLQLPDDTQCMGQWQGENRSDFFKFTAGQYKHYITTIMRQAEERAVAEAQLRPQPRNRLEQMIEDAVRILRNDNSLTVRIVPKDPQRAE